MKLGNHESRRVTGWIVVVVTALVAYALARLANPHTTGPMGTTIIDLEFPGTRETAWTLLRLVNPADHSALQVSLGWDLLFIVVYVAGLYAALSLLAPVVRDGRAALLDRVVPKLVIAAGVLDVVQDACIWWMLQMPPNDMPESLGALAAFTTIVSLANWTFVAVAVGHLVWLMLRDLPKRKGPQAQT